jgi:hypothetical protein
VATWRQKQAYTAISRARQKCYFIGKAPIELLNNMDMQALAFFNRLASSNQKPAETTDVVRNVFEMREFWVRRMLSRRNKRQFSEDADASETRTNQMRSAIPKQGRTVLTNEIIMVYANTYPNCEQNIARRGHILAATSNENKLLLLKRYCKDLGRDETDKKRTNEIQILNNCRDISGVLKLLATVDQGIVLERMASRVHWSQFVKNSSLEVKLNFRQNLTRILIALREKKIQHGHISDKTVWVDAKGEVKLAWFEDAQCNASDQSMDQDTASAKALFELLLPVDNDTHDHMSIDDDHLNADSVQPTTSQISDGGDYDHAIPCKIPYASCKADAHIHH